MFVKNKKEMCSQFEYKIYNIDAKAFKFATGTYKFQIENQISKGLKNLFVAKLMSQITILHKKT